MAPQNDSSQAPERVTGTMLEPLIQVTAPLPEVLQDKLTLSAWANSLVNGVPYVEPDPNYLSRLLLVQTLSAETPDDVFRQTGMKSLQDSVPNIPGGTTGNIDITDLYVTSSDFGEGAPCYMIMTVTSLETGEQGKYSTGASQLQAQILRLIGFGVWPIRCQITRIDRKDKGDRFLFWLNPPE